MPVASVDLPVPSTLISSLILVSAVSRWIWANRPDADLLGEEAFMSGFFRVSCWGFYLIPTFSVLLAADPFPLPFQPSRAGRHRSLHRPCTARGSFASSILRRSA